jgi:tetratricopeptide (TPR) repeat protein
MRFKLLAASTPIALLLWLPFLPVLSQTSAPLNCQTEVTRVRQEREYNTYVAPFDRWYSRLQNQNNPPLPVTQTATQTTQIVQNLNRTNDLKIITGVLEYLAGNNFVFGSNFTTFLIDSSQPTDRAALVTMVDTTYPIVRNLSSGYSRLKVQSLINLARAYKKLNVVDRPLSLLFEATQNVNGVRGAELQANLLSEIAKVYIQWNETGTAQQVLTQALAQSDKAAKDQTDPARKYASRWGIVSAYIEMGQVDRAIELLQPVTDTGMLDTLYVTAVRQYISQNSFDRATQVIARIPGAGAKAQAYTDLAVAYRRQNQIILADSTFDTAVKTARSNTTDGDPTLESIARTYAQAGGLESVERMVDGIPPNNRGYVLMTLAGEYDKRGQAEKSKQFLDRLITLSSSVPDAIGAWIYNSGISGGYFATALEALRRTNASADQYDSFVYYAIANGKIDSAAEIARSLGTAELDRKNRLLQQVAVGYAKANQPEQAFSTVQTITNDGNEPYQIITIAQIAAIQRSQGQNASADSLFARANQQASALTNMRQKVFALGTIARELHASGLRQQAQSVVNQVIQAIGNSTDVTLYEGLLSLFIQADQLDRAWQIGQAVPKSLQSKTQYVSFLELMNASINAGRFDIAVAAAKATPAPPQQARAFVNIAKAQLTGQTTPPLGALALALQAAKTVPGAEQILIELPPDLDGISRGTVEDADDRGSLYEEIALLYAQSGYVQRGLEVAQLLQDTRNRDRIRQHVNCFSGSR